MKTEDTKGLQIMETDNKGWRMESNVFLGMTLKLSTIFTSAPLLLAGTWTPHHLRRSILQLADIEREVTNYHKDNIKMMQN